MIHKAEALKILQAIKIMASDRNDALLYCHVSEVQTLLENSFLPNNEPEKEAFEADKRFEEMFFKWFCDDENPCSLDRNKESYREAFKNGWKARNDFNEIQNRGQK